MDALGAAAIAEETEQNQDEDHNQNDHENAEDAPPLVANVYALSHLKRVGASLGRRARLLLLVERIFAARVLGARLGQPAAEHVADRDCSDQRPGANVTERVGDG